MVVLKNKKRVLQMCNINFFYNSEQGYAITMMNHYSHHVTKSRRNYPPYDFQEYRGSFRHRKNDEALPDVLYCDWSTSIRERYTFHSDAVFHSCRTHPQKLASFAYIESLSGVPASLQVSLYSWLMIYFVKC